MKHFNTVIFDLAGRWLNALAGQHRRVSEAGAGGGEEAGGAGAAALAWRLRPCGPGCAPPSSASP